MRDERSDRCAPRDHMTALSAEVARVVMEQHPYALCLACLAATVGASEPEVRSAAQVLVVSQGFCTVVRTCPRCERTDLTLVAKKPD